MSQKINIVLVEDEAHNLRLLQGMIKKLRPGWQVAATFESVAETIKWLKTNPQPDLLFLDIQLADGLCFSIFEQIEVKSLVIFTTAYDQYAIRAFKVNSIDYLLKPFKESELEAAILKFEHFSAMAPKAPDNEIYAELLEAIKKGEKHYRKRFLVSKGTGFVKIETGHIAYFYNENRITTAFSFGRQTYMLDFSLESLEEQLDPALFFRANRQLIVNIEAIEKIENYFGGKLKLRLNPHFEGDLMVSRLKAVAFRRWMGQ